MTIGRRCEHKHEKCTFIAVTPTRLYGRVHKHSGTCGYETATGREIKSIHEVRIKEIMRSKEVKNPSLRSFNGRTSIVLPCAS
jgi:hypothetical protein